MSLGTTGGRARRSTLALLTGAALTVLLTIATAGAAQGGSPTGAQTGGAAVAARTDSYIRDVVGDTGVQPHNLNPLWASPDIKVCPTAIECATSQNPIVGVTNYIFVKLNNPGPYGSGVDSGTLQMYRTTPGGGAVWPIHWTFIGSTGAVVFPGTTTVMIPWNGVPGPGHFCLVARWVSATDPFTFEGPDIGTNTRYNNNIAWRNVDSVRVILGGPIIVRPFAIGNPLTRATKSDIVFTPGREAFQAVGGRVVADLGPTLFERWVQGGRQGKGVREVGKTQVEILEPQASINGLVLDPSERVEFSLLFSAKAATRQPVTLDVTQFGPDATGAERADLGGVRYEITAGQDKG